jgi:LacI family transcriptional regulator
MAVKLTDIARIAGVSKTTVSRALSNPSRVSTKSRTLVQKTAKKLNYVSDGVAQALSNRRTKTIGAVVPTLESAIYAISIQGLESELAKFGYTLLIASHGFNLSNEITAVTSLVSRGVDALTLVGLTHDQKTFAILERAGVPYVCSWNYQHKKSKHQMIGFDNQKAGEILVNHLVSLGHRKIAVISGILKGNDRATDRIIGIRRALHRYQLNLLDHHLVEQPYGFSGGAIGLSALMKMKDPPTAIICGNDLLAIGALAEAEKSGLNVPKELSVTGFDGMEISGLIKPALTTISIPMFQLGVNVANFLLAELGETTRSEPCELEFSLLIRDSTSNPPKLNGIAP